MTDCTDQVRRAAKQSYKYLPENDVIFFLERLSPFEESEDITLVVADAIRAAKEAVESVRDQGKRISLIADYDYSNIPELSRLLMRKDQLLTENSNLGESFYLICLYASHQTGIMTKTFAAIMNLFSRNAKFAHSFDEALSVTADTLGMQ